MFNGLSSAFGYFSRRPVFFFGPRWGLRPEVVHFYCGAARVQQRPDDTGPEKDPDARHVCGFSTIEAIFFGHAFRLFLPFRAQSARPDYYVLAHVENEQIEELASS